MAKLSTKKASNTHRIMIYGPPKSGKTLLAAKLAEYYNLLWFDLENGHSTLFKLPEKWKERIELINIPDTRSYPIAIETLLKVIRGPVSICEEHGKVSCAICKRKETDLNKITEQEEGQDVHESLFIDIDLNKLDSNSIVVFDSATQLTNSAIANITKGESDDYKLKTDDYGHLGKLLDIFFSHLQQASYNVIVISHEIEAETEGKKRTLVPVSGSRNYSRNVAKYFDHIVYAERKNKQHVFASSTQYAINLLTGSRTDVSIEDSDEPSLLSIFKPELYAPNNTVSAAATVTSNTTNNKVNTGGKTATDILARLKKMKK